MFALTMHSRPHSAPRTQQNKAHVPYIRCHIISRSLHGVGGQQQIARMLMPRGARCTTRASLSDIAPPAFADFDDDDDDTAFIRALNSLRRGIIMLFLRMHNSLAAQQAFLLLEALTRVPPAFTLQRLLPELVAHPPRGPTSPPPPTEEAPRTSVVPVVLDIIKQAPKTGGFMQSIHTTWFQARLLPLSILTAGAFMIAGLVCILLGMPPQRTSLAVEPARIMLRRYVEYLQQFAGATGGGVAAGAMGDG